ncbi:MAG: hypothetical protein CMJ59_07740 [Planctomycetaceae bacterium]|nr:hypothetical protein [Planctomycetaceae bacterium]
MRDSREQQLDLASIVGDDSQPAVTAGGPSFFVLERCGLLNMTAPENLQIFEQLKPGDRVELTHEVKVGFRQWNTVTQGTVVRTERRRHGLHYDRNRDDKVFSDVIVLSDEEGALTTVTLDEFTDLKKLTAEPS